MNHQQFYFIKRSNPTLININVFWLLFIALVPFSTELIGEYGNYFTASLIFQLNLFFAGVFYYLNWHYASSKGLIDKNLDQKTVNFIKRNNLIFPVLSLLAMVLAYYVLAWSSLIYLSTPILKKILQKRG
jgi:TMEM175 potassium channel family protein